MMFGAGWSVLEVNPKSEFVSWWRILPSVVFLVSTSICQPRPPTHRKFSFYTDGK